MKHFDSMKKLLLAALVGVSGAAQAQTAHPNAFQVAGTTTTYNWYKDYVGLRFEVVSPSSVAGSKEFTTSTQVTPTWGGAVTAPIISTQIVMPASGDSLVSSALPAGSMAGKIAFVYRGGGVYFIDKALRAQNAGAVACVIVNNVAGSPILMGAAGSSAVVTIPVFMITKADGDAIDAAYHNLDTARFTITPWGLNNTNDVGFVPYGVSRFHNCVTPREQLATPGIDQFKGLDGAFVANYGSADANHVVLKSTVSYGAGYTMGGETVIHTDSVVQESFPRVDSVWAMYNGLYNISSSVPSSGIGHFNVRYDLTSSFAAGTDQYMGDNSMTYTFYTSDSLFCKGNYNFSQGSPVANSYRAATLASGVESFFWGPTYFVAKGAGKNFDRVQWRMSSNTDTGDHIESIENMPAFVFKWVDGTFPDSLLEPGELELIGGAVYAFSTSVPGDTSGGIFTAAVNDSNGLTANVALADNSWYFISPQLPSGWFIGVDWNYNTFNRVYGMSHFHNTIEPAQALWGGGRSSGANTMIDNPNVAMPTVPFGGSYDIDSVTYADQNLPNIAFWTTTHNKPVATASVAKPVFDLNVFPNPASDMINVNVSFPTTAKAVTYHIFNNMAQLVATETHYGVQSDKFSYNTSKLASGNYYVAVTADGKQMFRKFVVAH